MNTIDNNNRKEADEVRKVIGKEPTTERNQEATMESWLKILKDDFIGGFAEWYDSIVDSWNIYFNWGRKDKEHLS